MATMVCQGLQSRIETEHRKFRLKLSSPRTHFSDLAFIKPLFEEIKANGTTTATATATAAICSNDDKISTDMGGWAFLQSLSSSHTTGEEEEKPYVHPMSKRSLSSLSAKSLELCTENLGSETGSSDMLDDSDTIFNIVQQETNFVSPFTRQLCRASTTREFPPPLTTISGSSSSSFLPSFRMMPRREGGRLVIEAVKVPSHRNIFKAERSNGRLRLLLTVENDEEEEEEEEEDTDEIITENEEAMFCDEEEDEEGDIDGNKVKVWGEMEMEKKYKGASENGSGRYKEEEPESENKVY